MHVSPERVFLVSSTLAILELMLAFPFPPRRPPLPMGTEALLAIERLRLVWACCSHS